MPTAKLTISTAAAAAQVSVDLHRRGSGDRVF
jgi:hypothetical protein